MHSILTTPFQSEAANRYYCSHQGENKGTITSFKIPALKSMKQEECVSQKLLSGGNHFQGTSIFI